MARLHILCDVYRSLDGTPTRGVATDLVCVIVENRHQNGGNQDAQHRKPVKKWDTYELWLYRVIETGPERQREWEEQQQQEPGAIFSPCAGLAIYHDKVPFPHINKTKHNNTTTSYVYFNMLRSQSIVFLCICSKSTNTR